MNEAKQRVFIETMELEAKIGKLIIFTKTEKYKQLKFHMRFLLRKQLFFMKRYHKVLRKRVAIWDK